jgi:hypothetical protein
MKRLFVSLFIALSFLVAPIAWATTGSVVITQKTDKVKDGALWYTDVRRLVFSCIGDVTDGSIPDTTISASDLNFIRGWYLYRVEAYQTTVGVAPDADEADVFILDSDGIDYLGSEDGGTTAYAGLTLIHATLKQACLPNMYLPRAGNHVNYYWDITKALTLKVGSQATASADYTIELFFRIK